MMDIDKFKSVLMIGETSSVEFKRCGGEVEHDVFESICAFLNRFGGDVYLGVRNDGTVEGVNANNAAAMMKNKSMFVIERERMYTTNPCNPVRDGRITPENVHPKAKNPVIAGFFREIGRADRLGSGIRNLYKYCKDYGGSDPIFTEGNEFVISVSLKRLDPIRFPFEKPFADPKKVHIGLEKVRIGPEKVHIDLEKVHIQKMLDALNLNEPTVNHIVQLYARFGTEESFGRTEICIVTGLKERGASKLIGLMLRHRILVPVSGRGKGKYCFTNPVNLVNPVENHEH